jgi:hypothetical protein
MAKYGPKPKPLEERFWPKVEKTDGCWFWKAKKNNKGYGLILEAEKRFILAHRASWVMARGPIPDGQHVLHTCDESACVNPAHLFLGTQAANMRDMRAKGRHRFVAHAGEDNGHSKLTSTEVRAMRDLAASGWTHARLASAFKVARSNVSHIVTGKSWKDA